MCEMKKNFIVIIGDISNNHHNEMIKRMKNIGKVRQVMDCTYVLSTEKKSESQNEDTKEAIRTHIAGKDYGYCIVIDMNKIKAAWSLTKQNSDYLSSYFNSESNEKK